MLFRRTALDSTAFLHNFDLQVLKREEFEARKLAEAARLTKKTTDTYDMDWEAQSRKYLFEFLLVSFLASWPAPTAMCPCHHFSRLWPSARRITALASSAYAPACCVMCNLMLTSLALHRRFSSSALGMPITRLPPAKFIVFVLLCGRHLILVGSVRVH